MIRRFIAAVTLVLLVTSAGAQPLADRVPENVIFYFGWCGAKSMPSGYAGSHLDAVLKSSNLPAVFQQMVPQLLAKAGREGGPQAAEIVKTVNAVAGSVWNYPWALFADLSEGQDGPLPRVGLICQAGTNAASLQKTIDDLLAKTDAGRSPVPVRTFVNGNYFLLIVGNADDVQALTSDAPGNFKALGASDRFKSAMSQVGKDPALAAYIDTEELWSVIDLAVSAERGPAAEWWPKIREASGLSGLRRIAWTSGFDGKDWMDRAFVEAPAPRNGLLAAIDGTPVPNDLLAMVPVNATDAMAGGFDIAKLISEVRSALAEIDPQWQVNFDKGVGAAQLMLGKNPITDIFEPLGEHWLVYNDALTGGWVIVNKLDDPAKAEAGLNSLMFFANNMLMKAMSETPFQVQIAQAKVGDLNMRYFATPLISPAWTIKDGNLFIGMYPQTAAAAAKRGKPTKSILDNADFQALRTRLGGENPTAVRYVNLPSHAVASYGGLLAVSRLGLGFAEMWGIKSPELVMPTLEDLLSHLAPAGSVSWTDGSGFHAKAVSPFPGSELIGGSVNPQTMLGIVAMQTSILLPSLNRARETANRVKSSSNLRAIGQAILLYSNENKGKYPPDLGTVLTTQDISAEVFLSPRRDQSIPDNFSSLVPEERANWINENSDYVYLGAGMNNRVDADTIVAYENPAKRGISDGFNILFGDGHVEFQLMGPGQAMLAKQQSGQKK